jgi:hypothetical protein
MIAIPFLCLLINAIFVVPATVPAHLFEPMTTCKNCENTFEGKFCPNCSQKANTHRFNLYHFGHEFLHALTHTDKGILFLMKELFFRPGKVALEYNAGKRKKYFNPITFLLIVMAIQVYAIKKTDFYGHFASTMKEYMTTLSEKTGKIDDQEREDIDKTMQDVKKQTNIASENSKLITFLFVPLLALLTWLFYFRTGHNYAENLVFNIFIISEQTAFFLLICIPIFLIWPSLVVWLMYLYFIFLWVYTFIAYRQFFKQGWGWTLLKGSAIQVIYLVIVNYASVFFKYLG